MSITLLSSSVESETLPPKSVPITGGRTAVIGLIGTASMGPVGLDEGEAFRFSSWDEFKKVFGSHDANSTLPLQAAQVWAEDPAAVVVAVRTVHYTTISDPTTKTSTKASATIASVATAATAGAVTGSVAGHTYMTPGGVSTRAWRLTNGDTVIVHIDADALGPDTATISATADTLTGGATALPVNMGDTITFTCDQVPGSQVVTYSAAHATIEAVAQDINAQVAGFRAVVVGGLTINFVTDTIGSDAAVAITAETGTGAQDIGHTAPSAGAGAGGNVGNVFHVTWQELKTIIEAAVTHPATGCTVSLGTGNFLVITSDTTGALSSVQVTAGSTADDELGLDNIVHSGSAASSVTALTAYGKWDGTYPTGLRIVISAASNEDANYFNLTVTDDTGAAVEPTFTNVQNLTTTAADFVETVINADPSLGGSYYISITDAGVAIRPANGTYTPAGGNNGLVGLVDNDFIGNAAGGTGLHAFDRDETINLIADGGRATSAWQNGLITYCTVQRNGRCFFVLDPPAGLTYAQMRTYKLVTAALSSDYGIVTWPRIKILNPDETAYTSDTEGNITIAPSATLCGMISRNDAWREGGIFTQPCGPDTNANNGILYSVTGVSDIAVRDKRVRDALAPDGVCPIRQDGGGRPYLDDERTLNRTSTRSAWDTIAAARGMMFIKTSLIDGMAWARHKNIDDALFNRVNADAIDFLDRQKTLGAFDTVSGAAGYKFQCDDKNNPASTRKLKRLYMDIGTKMAEPAIWVIERFYALTE